jgi:hypothetical protein
MNTQMEFEIHYQFKGEPRHFLHQALHLCQSDALHFATLHAGVGTFSGNVAAGPIKLATLQAQGFGVTQVHWKKRAGQPWAATSDDQTGPAVDASPCSDDQIAG